MGRGKRKEIKVLENQVRAEGEKETGASGSGGRGSGQKGGPARPRVQRDVAR